MRRHTITAITLTAITMGACTLDNLKIPDLPGGGSDLIAGAWEKCEGWDDESCSPAELGCYLPTSQEAELAGHCTWLCGKDSDCKALKVDQEAWPTCIPYLEKDIGVCALGCANDGDCPPKMDCHEVETDPGLTSKICTWPLSGLK